MLGARVRDEGATIGSGVPARGREMSVRTAERSGQRSRELGRAVAGAGRVHRPVTVLLLPPRSIAGFVVGLLWFGASVVPSLLPRGWLAQGVLSGVALAVGYGLGLVAGAVGRGVAGRAVPAAARAACSVVCLVLASFVAALSLVVHQQWQTDVRGLMGLESSWYHTLGVAATALLTAMLLVAMGRIIGAAHRAYVRGVGRVVPWRGRRPVRLLIALIATVVTFDLVLAGWTVGTLRDAFAAADARYDTEVTKPRSGLRSGGPGSLVAWEELGRMGRSFTGTGPTVEQLAAFRGRRALQPIRVYVGLASAQAARPRAELAVEELERTGAFDREVLLVVTPTGTGWVDPSAIDPLEYVYGGDTASVAVQYSYQPSWATMMGNQDRAADGARALLDAVIARLESMPSESRPQLLLYGQSLGAFGFGRLFASLDQIPQHVTGVLWAGAPSATPLWQELVADRDAGSPVWEPVVQGGRQVRFGATGTALSRPAEHWERPRVAFLQNATDPIVWWRPRLLVERPEWMDEPRGPGVSQTMPFVPIVTGVQVGLDLLQSMGVPAGNGHVFGPAHAEAWTLIAPPPGWSSDETTRLLATLAAADEERD